MPELAPVMTIVFPSRRFPIAVAIVRESGAAAKLRDLGASKCRALVENAGIESRRIRVVELIRNVPEYLTICIGGQNQGILMGVGIDIVTKCS